MELRHLRDFVAVAEEHSFTRAATTLHLTQPALTRQIKNLEEEIGVRLFDRANGRVSLTEEGKAFVNSARRVLDLSAESVREVQRLARGEAGQLNIGYTANSHCHVLPAALAAFKAAHPRVGLHLFDMPSAAQVDALRTRQIDVGFVGLPQSLTGTALRGQCIAHYYAVAAVARGTPLSKKSSVQLKDMEGLFFVVLSELTYPGWLEWTRRTCSEYGFAPRILQEVDDPPAILRFVAGGLGVSVVSEQIKLLPHRGVVFRPLSPPVKLETIIAWQPDNSSTLLKHYIDLVTTIAAKAPP